MQFPVLISHFKSAYYGSPKKTSPTVRFHRRARNNNNNRSSRECHRPWIEILFRIHLDFGCGVILVGLEGTRDRIVALVLRVRHGTHEIESVLSGLG